jgi:cytochrome oxidase Cu insertion factor (SCO1/SenC/PrrC family)
MTESETQGNALVWLNRHRGLAAVALVFIAAGGWYLLSPRGGAAGFALTDIDGTRFRLRDHRGKVVLLDFMATSCGPCRRSMPDLLEIRSIFGEELVMISISIDPFSDTNERLRSWADAWGADWIHARDTAYPPIGQQYEASRIPTLVIIDKKGEISFRHVGLTTAETLMSEISELMSK